MSEVVFPQDEWAKKAENAQIDRTVYELMGGAILVLAGVWIGAQLFTNDGGYGTNLFTEFISIAVTVFVLDIVNRRRTDRERQKRLKVYAASNSNLVALQALDELRAEGWLDLLQNKDVELWNADWTGAYLEKVNLQDKSLVYIELKEAKVWNSNLACTDLRQANLRHTSILATNLQHTNLTGANLQQCGISVVDMQHAILVGVDCNHAHLNHVNFEYAKLHSINLQNAYLSEINLHHTDLTNASLANAILGPGFERSKLDKSTILPDGTHYIPKEDFRQLERFIDPEHPNFWQPDWIELWKKTGVIPAGIERI